MVKQMRQRLNFAAGIKDLDTSFDDSLA